MREWEGRDDDNTLCKCTLLSSISIGIVFSAERHSEIHRRRQENIASSNGRRDEAVHQAIFQPALT